MIVRDDPGIAAARARCRRGVGPGARRRGRVVDGDALVSHEFFCAASPEQAARMVEQLAPAEVHVVITAREPLGLFTSSWQESLKNKSHDAARRLRPHGVRRPPRRLGLALARPRAGAGPLGARRAARAAARDHPAAARLGPRGAVGAVRRRARHRPGDLRRVPRLRQRLDGRGRGRDAAPGQRAAHRLQHRPRPRACGCAPSSPTSGWCRGRASRSGRPTTRSRTPGPAASAPWSGCAPRRTTSSATSDLLRVPEDLPPRRHPDSVTDAEVAEVAVDLVATLMGDLQRRSGPHGAAERAAVAPVPPAPGPPGH